MAYTREYWEDAPSTATPITADRLNNIELGILDAHNEIDEIETELPKKTPYKEIINTGFSFNGLTETGLYNIVNPHNPTDAPSGFYGGLLIVSDYSVSPDKSLSQMLICSAAIYNRRYVYSSRWQSGSWSEWEQLLNKNALQNDLQSIQKKIDSLSTVASSGSYNDLTDKPIVYNRSEVDALIADLQDQINNIDTSGSLPNGDEVSY